MTTLPPIRHIVGTRQHTETLGTGHEPVIVNKMTRMVIKLHYRRCPAELARRLLLIGELSEAGAGLLPPASMVIILDQNLTVTVCPLAEPCDDSHLAGALAKLHSVTPSVISQDTLSSLTAFEIESRTQSRLAPAEDRLRSSTWLSLEPELLMLQTSCNKPWCARS